MEVAGCDIFKTFVLGIAVPLTQLLKQKQKWITNLNDKALNWEDRE